MEAKQQHQYLPHSMPTQSLLDESVAAAARLAKQEGHMSARMSALQQRGLVPNPGSVDHAAVASVVGELDAELRVEVSARIDRVTVELHRELTRRFEEFQGRLDKLIELSEPLAKMDARLLRLEEARLDLRLGALESAAHHSAVFVPPPSKLDASMQFSSQPVSRPDFSPASLQFSSMQIPASPQWAGPEAMSPREFHTPLKPPLPVATRSGKDPSQIDSLSLPGVTARSSEHREAHAEVSQHHLLPPSSWNDLDLTTKEGEMVRYGEYVAGGSPLDSSAQTTAAVVEASSQINVTSSSSGCASTVVEDKSTSAIGEGMINARAFMEPSSSPVSRRESADPDELGTIAAAAAAAAAAYGKDGQAGALDWQPAISDELKSRLEGLMQSVKKTLSETRQQQSVKKERPARVSSSCTAPEQQQQRGVTPLKASPIAQVVGGSFVGSVGGSLTVPVRVLSPVRGCSPIRGSASVLIPQVPSQIAMAPTSGSALITQEVQMGEACMTEMHIGPQILRPVSIARQRGASPTRGCASPIRAVSPRRLVMTSAVIPVAPANPSTWTAEVAPAAGSGELQFS